MLCSRRSLILQKHAQHIKKWLLCKKQWPHQWEENSHLCSSLFKSPSKAFVLQLSHFLINGMSFSSVSEQRVTNEIHMLKKLNKIKLSSLSSFYVHSILQSRGPIKSQAWLSPASIDWTRRDFRICLAITQV